jgi:hypothetical protein
MSKHEIDIMWQKAMCQSIEEGEMFTRYHFAKLVAERALADSMREVQRLGQEIEQEPVALDLSQVNRLTHFKTNGIIDAHKYNITGFVLTNGDGKKCISDMAAVRWFDNKDFFGMMHNEPAYPPQRKPLTEQEMFEAIRPLYSSEKDARLTVAHSEDEYRAIEAAHGIKETT